jgi:hypothetical protein
LALTACLALVAGSSITMVGQVRPEFQSGHRSPTGVNVFKKNYLSEPDSAIPMSSAASATDPIWFHWGPIMLGTTHLYYIWYGNWSPTSSTVGILTDFAKSLGGSPYFSINATYTDFFGRSVSNSLSFGGSLYDNYSRGANLTDSDIYDIVMAKQPYDPYGVYMVLTSGDVRQSGSSGRFGTQYCGWHNHSFQLLTFRDIKYGFVGSPDLTPSCVSQQSSSPNGNPAADSMASSIAHEISETVTDPDFDAWFDSNGNEMADKCAWNFGSVYRAGNGSQANVRLGNRDFLIQQLWVNATSGYCAMSLGAPAHGDTMQPGEALYPGEMIQSQNGRYTFTLQADGNLVLYKSGGSALWSSHTQGQQTEVSIMQADGNLVNYWGELSPSHANWASHTSGNSGSHLVVQNDGNVVIYHSNGSSVWATNTVQQ